MYPPEALVWRFKYENCRSFKLDNTDTEMNFWLYGY